MTLRQDTSGDKFRIELDKLALDNRGVTGELLLRRAENPRPGCIAAEPKPPSVTCSNFTSNAFISSIC